VLGRGGDAEGVLAGAPVQPLSRTVLEWLYRREKMSPREIARATGSTPRKVSYQLERFGIARFRLGDRIRVQDLTPETLRSLYVDQQWSTAEIAVLLACSPRRVSGLLHGWGIEASARGGRTPLSRRVLEDLHVARGLTVEQIAVRLGYLRASGKPDTAMVRVALYRHGLNLPHSEREISDADLEALYVGEGLDEAQIAERLGWRSPHGEPSVIQIRRRLVRAGIYRPRIDPSPEIGVALRLYREEGLSLEQIALRLGWLTRSGRPAVLRVRRCLERAGESVPRAVNHGYHGPPPFDAERLRRLYVDEGLGLRQVAERLGWRARSGAPQKAAVKAALVSAGIATRPQGKVPRGKR
jgi:DNA-binding CsgD family transcriptional regulator